MRIWLRHPGPGLKVDFATSNFQVPMTEMVGGGATGALACAIADAKSRLIMSVSPYPPNAARRTVSAAEETKSAIPQDTIRPIRVPKSRSMKTRRHIASCN